MKINKILLIIPAVLFSFLLHSQSEGIGWEYTYDGSGNRISRTVLYMMGTRSTSDTTINNIEFYSHIDIEEENPDEHSLKMKAGDVNLSIFPNPVREYVNIEILNSDNYNNEKVSYQIIDMNGRIVDKNKLNSHMHTINFSNKSKGSYILRIFIDDTHKDYKIIKE